MFSSISRNRFVWVHATIYGLLATAVKLILAPQLWPSPIVAGIAAFLISAVAYRARLAAGKPMTILWGAGIGAATGLLTPLLMYLLHGVFLGLSMNRPVEMLGWSIVYAFGTLMQVGIYLTAGGAVVGVLLHYVQSAFLQKGTSPQS
jgi:hypothetical protein